MAPNAPRTYRRVLVTLGPADGEALAALVEAEQKLLEQAPGVRLKLTASELLRVLVRRAALAQNGATP